MFAAPALRLTGGAVASVLLHGGLIAAVFLIKGAPQRPSPPVYRVQLFAAPAGERAAGVVQAQPAPVIETPPPLAKPIAPRERVPVVKPKPAPTPRVATPAAPTKSADEPRPTTQAPTAGGGPTGGKGADVANVDTHGIEFPYKYYTDGIVREIIRQFGETSMRFTAEIRFVIRRDGSVDPASINFVTRSNNYAFDTKAKAAIEAVANAKLFGPLPDGFREDILPVTFRFSPQLMR